MKKKSQYIHNIKLIAKISKSSTGTLMHLNIITQIINSLTPFVVIYFIKLFIDAINSGHSSLEIYKLLIYTGLAFLIQHLLKIISESLNSHISENIRDYIMGTIQHKSSELPLRYFEDSEFQNLLRIISSETPYRASTILSNLIGVLQNSTAIIIIIIYLAFLHPLALPVIILSALPAIISRYIFAKKIFNWNIENEENKRMFYYLNRILTTPKFSKELRLFGTAKLFNKRFNKIALSLRESKLKLIDKKNIYNAITLLLIIVSMFALLFILTQKAITRVITIGTLVMFFMILRQGFVFFSSLLTSIFKLTEDQLYINNYDEFINLKSENHNPEEKTMSTLNDQITIKDLWFKYPKKNAPYIFKGLSLNIPKGKTIAIVGENGAGKSTLVKLLCKLYIPTKGQILYDKTNITEIDTNTLRKNISAIFQDYILYNLSIKDNMYLGDIDKPVNIDKLKTVSEQSGINKVIDTLPLEYDTTLGVLFKNSRELSIGEWQKIAISRALYRDAPIIILDEPSSSLDAKSEYYMFNKLHEITKNTTAILISHRFSTVKMADIIYVIDNGTVVESGNHKELLSKNGKYAKMYNLQAANYSD